MDVLWAWILASLYTAEHGNHYPGQSNMAVILWARMLWSLLYALEHGLWSLYAAMDVMYPVGMDAMVMVIVRSRKWISLSCAVEHGCYSVGTDALVIIVCTRTWTMVIVRSHGCYVSCGHGCYGHGHRTHPKMDIIILRSRTWMLSCGHGCSGHCMHPNMDYGHCTQSNMDIVILWVWMLLAAAHGYRYPAQLNSIDPLGMDAMVIVYAAEQAWMLWSLYAAEHGCCYAVGLDALIIVCN